MRAASAPALNSPAMQSPAMKAAVIASIFLLGLATGLAIPEGTSSAPTHNVVKEERRS
jgi:hypothetical protein